MDDKKFVIPEAEILDFAAEDIITYSVNAEFPDEWTGEDWNS